MPGGVKLGLHADYDLTLRAAVRRTSHRGVADTLHLVCGYSQYVHAAVPGLMLALARLQLICVLAAQYLELTAQRPGTSKKKT